MNVMCTCWSLDEIYDFDTGEMLFGTKDDMSRSASRVIDFETGKPVREWEAANNVQKRIVLYHKTFHHLYGIGQRGIRVQLPSCLVTRIKRKWPGKSDIENEGEFIP